MSDGDPTRLCSCGCCDDGVETPSHPNPPGLPEIGYRLGGHPDFLHRMTARIHAWEVLTCADCDVRFAGPDRLARILEHIARAHPEAVDPADLVVAERPLAELGTRDADDPAIALMDAWAVVGDVLTFYQERFANESYLRTATERRSILELARAIGYELDPGVAAETYLAFTVDDAEGSPAQAHVPAGTQVLSIPSSSDEVPQTFETDEVLTARVEWNDLRPRMAHPLTLAADLSHVFLEGTATGLSAGRPVLLLLAGTPVVKRVARVHADTDAGHTKVDFSTGNAAPSATLPTRPDGVLDPDQDPLELTRAAVEAQIVHRTWAESDLQAFLTQHDWDPEAVLTYVADLRAATFRDPTRSLLAFRDTLGFFGHNAPFFDSLPDLDPDTGSGGGGGSVGSLTEAASIQAPPAEAAVQGGGGSSAVQVGGGSGGTGKAWPHDWDRPGGFSIWLDSLTDGYYRTSGEPYDVYLERPVEGLVGGSWAVIERPVDTFGIYEIAGVTEGSRTGFGMSTKVAGLRLEQGGADLGNHTSDKPADFNVRRSTAHVRSEALDLAPLPLTDDLTAGTTELRLGTMVLGLEAGRIVALRGEEVDADGAIREELLTLDSVAHASGYTTLHFEEGPLRSYVRSTVTLNANVALASHGETVTDEVLGSGDGAARHQRFTLKKPPLTHRSAVGGSESALTVRVGGVAWDQVDSLYGLDGTRRAYIVRIDDDAEATVTFGDAWSGAPLPTGQENVRATYRSGIGAEGEVGAGSLTLLKTRPFGIRAVTNPLAASGAEDPETLDDARDNAPLTVLTLDRIVSLRDYEDYARAFPGIGKARADSVWNGEGEVVHVTVADADGDPVVDPLYGRLLESMESARDPLRPVALETYQPFVFFVTAKVLIDDARRWEDVEPAVRSGLKEAFGFEARSFAQVVTAAEILQVMHAVEGVLAVDLDELYRTAPDAAAPPAGLFNTVLDARPARFDEPSKTILPADLLLIHPLGIDLSEMVP